MQGKLTPTLIRNKIFSRIKHSTVSEVLDYALSQFHLRGEHGVYDERTAQVYSRKLWSRTSEAIKHTFLIYHLPSPSLPLQPPLAFYDKKCYVLAR